MIPHHWRDDAACQPSQHAHPEWFFPIHAADLRRAQAVCRSCLVTAECAAYAAEHRIQYGVWGGRMKSPRAERLSPCGTRAGWNKHQRDDEPPCDLCEPHAPHFGAKLTTDDVATLRADYARGVSATELAERYGIRDYYVRRIARGAVRKGK